METRTVLVTGGAGLMGPGARELGPQELTYKLPLEIIRKAPRVWVNKLM